MGVDAHCCPTSKVKFTTKLCALQLNSTTQRPPVVPSAEFTADFEYTLAYGSINSTNRTAYETETAKFWYDETPGT